MQHKKEKVDAVIADYVTTKLTLLEIADKHDVSLPTITAWVRQARQPLRGQGRRPKTVPDRKDRKAVRLRQNNVCFQDIGAQLKTSKQNAFRMVKRWRNYDPATQSAPFLVGDILKWKNEQVCVVAAEAETGTVRDRHGNLMPFVWTINGRSQAVKVGHDPAFGCKNGHQA